MWMQILAMIFGVRVKIYQNPARVKLYILHIDLFYKNSS